MSSNDPQELSRARQQQRAHAKQRLQERFQMDMNRDQLHALERKISAGEAVAIESKNGKINYFVEIAGKLVLVGYDPVTHRIVTALPDDYLRKIPPELVTLARAKLFAAAQQTILDAIAAGAGRLVSQRGQYHLYEVEYESVWLHVGYDCAVRRLAPFPKRRGKPKTIALKVESKRRRTR
jgi:hypothetical protein